MRTGRQSISMSNEQQNAIYTKTASKSADPTIWKPQVLLLHPQATWQWYLNIRLGSICQASVTLSSESGHLLHCQKMRWNLRRYIPTKRFARRYLKKPTSHVGRYGCNSWTNTGSERSIYGKPQMKATNTVRESNSSHDQPVKSGITQHLAIQRKSHRAGARKTT